MITMEIEITSQRNNPFFNRTELHFIIHHENEGTPNRDLIRSELAEKLNAKKEAVVIQEIEPSFGIHKSKGYAKIYTSREKAENLEYEYVLKRNKIEEKKKEGKETEETKEETVDETSEEKEGEEKPVEETGKEFSEGEASEETKAEEEKKE